MFQALWTSSELRDFHGCTHSAHRVLRSPADQSKIRLAVGLRRVDPEDVPTTAKVPDPVLSTPGPSQRKRKLQYEASFGASQGTPPSSSQPALSQAPSSSQPPSSQPLRRISGLPAGMAYPQRVEEEVVEEVVEEESRDELYLMLKTSIVGIQYYKGSYCSCSDHSIFTVLQAWLGRANKCGLFESPTISMIG